MKTTTWCAAAAAGLVLAACGSGAGTGGGEPDARAAVDSPDPAVRTVQWLFQPDAGERPPLDSLLDALARSEGGPDLRHGGELHRFGARGRYLLAASRAADASPGREDLVDALEPGGGRGYGEPFRVPGSAEFANPFTVARIEDFDGDGAADLAYCTEGTEESGGTPGVVGYRAGRWYGIQTPRTASLCR
jgi:hypothetical protein